MSKTLFPVLRFLSDKRVHFSINWNPYVRSDIGDFDQIGTILVLIALPGARIELEFREDEDVHCSIFEGNEVAIDVNSIDSIEKILSKYLD